MFLQMASTHAATRVGQAAPKQSQDISTKKVISGGTTGASSLLSNQRTTQELAKDVKSTFRPEISNASLKSTVQRKQYETSSLKKYENLLNMNLSDSSSDEETKMLRK